ncbi:signal peptidase I [Chitinophaga rhizosphaerae]|uniref:signal peptidase I n=1 Tax=Chitinophaga rhizosphaerae TaxID=1864947 RepID=UPI000F80696C|nr:signal peptidase I [Chitinophaga rhizosphaerae]
MNLVFWKKKDGQPKKKKSAVREWLDAAIFAIIAATLIRTFIFEAYTIPTPSMEKTLLVNDFLFVSKVSYGPRIPMTPLAVPFTHHTLPFTKYTKAYSEAVQWKYRRLPGFSDIKRNDVVVFNFPEGDTVALEIQESGFYSDEVRKNGRDFVWNSYHIISRPVDKRENYIKRCVGIPGDSLAIRNGVIVVNGVAETPPPAGERYYTVQTRDGSNINPMRLEELGIEESPAGNVLNMTPSEAKSVENLGSAVTGVTPYVYEEASPDVWPHDTSNFKYTIDNFGPIYIPKKGATVKLDSASIEMYRRIIAVYEGNKLEERGPNQFYINGQAASNYTFKMDYYWMMGDNRHRSLDSRYWGFVPEDHIVGKAWMIWMSYGKNGIRWSRLFRTIK